MNIYGRRRSNIFKQVLQKTTFMEFARWVEARFFIGRVAADRLFNWSNELIDSNRQVDQNWKTGRLRRTLSIEPYWKTFTDRCIYIERAG